MVLGALGALGVRADGMAYAGVPGPPFIASVRTLKCEALAEGIRIPPRPRRTRSTHRIRSRKNAHTM
jgi:hypothetical protein